MQIMKSLRPNILLFISFAALVAVSGCKKKGDTPVPVSNPLMTIDFTDNYVNPKLGALVFISDMNGELLADTLFTGNQHLVIYPMAGKTAPARFMVTIASWEPNMHNFTISMNTYLYIEPAAWRLKGERHDTLGHITVSLSNVPAHTGPVLYANLGFSNLTFATLERINYVYVNPDDLYIKINTASGVKYVWQTGIAPGGTYTTDMAQTLAAETKTIALPGTAVYYEATLTGYRQPFTEGAQATEADEVFGDGTPASSITVSYPPSTYTSFNTDLNYTADWTSNITWRYHVQGAIPDAFKQTSATVHNVTPVPGTHTLSINTGGDFTTANANWIFMARNNQIFQWTVTGPDSITTIHLPKLPPSVAKMFPVLALDSLTLSNIELSKCWSHPSYPAYLQAIFDPTQPHSAETMEVSSMVWGNAKK